MDGCWGCRCPLSLGGDFYGWRGDLQTHQQPVLGRGWDPLGAASTLLPQPGLPLTPRDAAWAAPSLQNSPSCHTQGTGARKSPPPPQAVSEASPWTASRPTGQIVSQRLFAPVKAAPLSKPEGSGSCTSPNGHLLFYYHFSSLPPSPPPRPRWLPHDLFIPLRQPPSLREGGGGPG